jgi:4-amino-4-deoxy-L-arabinose transferase-like glycosyltransferase
LDATFLAFAMGGYWAYARSWADERWLAAVGALVGLAYLSKSLMAGFVGTPIVLDLLLFDRSRLRSRSLYAGAAAFAVCAGGWHLWLKASHGFFWPASYDRRVLTGIAGDYSVIAMVKTLVAAEGAANFAWAVGVIALATRARRSRVARLMLLAVLSGVAILLATATAMPHYALPLFPPLAIGAGWAVGKLVARRPVFAPLAVAAALGAFASGNLALLMHPDLSPGARETAEHVRKLAPNTPVLSYRAYNAAFDYYLQGRTTLVTDTEDSYRLYTSHGAMKNGPGVELASPAALAVRLNSPGTAYVTTLPFEPGLARYYAAAAKPPTTRRAGGYVLYYSER